MKNQLGQYFTPRHIADLMVSRLSVATNERILEPSAGEGVFLDALRDAGFQNYIGIEIDSLLRQDPAHQVEHASFVSWKPNEQFSAIIGNPPYIRWKHLDVELQQELKNHKLWGVLFNPLSDYLSVFIANAIEHLREGGQLIFITPSFWMHTLHAHPLRQWMLKQGAITELIDFGESQVFQGVSSAIVIFKFTKGAHPVDITYWKYIGGRRVSPEITLESSRDFLRMEIPAFQPDKHWSLADADTQSLIDRLEFAATTKRTDTLFSEGVIARLGEYVDIANGMVSGLDRAFRYDRTIEELSAAEQDALMRVAKAKDLGFLTRKSESRYINVPGGLTQDQVESTYPHFWARLNGYSEQLSKRYSYGRELPIWEWAFRRSEEFLTNMSPKILVPCKERMTNKRTARFALVEGGVVATQDVTAIAPKSSTRESIEYILGYLSTTQVSEWIRVRGLMKGGIAEFSEKPLSDIPFRSIDWSDPSEVAFHDHVTRLVRNHVANPADTDSTIHALSQAFHEFG